MITKVGKAVLKANSKKMDRLNSDLARYAKELQEMDHRSAVGTGEPQPPGGQLTYLESFFQKVRDNRIEWERLQEQIGILCKLEAFLK